MMSLIRERQLVPPLAPLTLLTLSMSSALLSALIGCGELGDRYALGELSLAQRVEWSDVEPLIKLRCANCHADPPLVGAPQPLLTYEQVAPWIDRIAARALKERDMPPGGLQDEADIELLRAWIDQGAPYRWEADVGEVAGEVTGEVAGEVAGTTAGTAAGELAGELAGEPSGGEPRPPTWRGEIFQLFEIYCNTCHADPPTGGAPYPLKTYEQALPQLERFRARVIERRDMPPGGIQDPEELELIRAWIEAGGPE